MTFRSNQHSLNTCKQASQVISLRGFSLMAVAFCMLMAGCEKAPEATSKSRLVHSSSSDTVSEVAALIKDRARFPPEIVDAHHVEYTVGPRSRGLDIGPVDYVSYLSLQVPVKDIESWTKNFKRLDNLPQFSRPECPCEWWVTQSEFASLEFYEPYHLSHRSRGWIGIARQEGKIYLATRTM